MTPIRRSRSSAALVAAVGALVLGSAASAVAADLAPGVEKDAMFRGGGSFAQEVAPDGVDVVAAAMAAVRGAAGAPSSPFAAAEPGAISVAAALLEGGTGASADAGAFAGEAGGFGRLRSVGYGGEGGLMAVAVPGMPARYAAPDAPVAEAIAAVAALVGGDASFSAPLGVGSYDAVREAAAGIGSPAESGRMSGAVFAGAPEPSLIRAAASYASGGKLGYSAPLTGMAGLADSGDAAFAAEADAGMAARLRRAAASIGAADNGFSASIGTGIATGEATGGLADPGLRQPDLGIAGDDATEVMRGLLERGT